LNIKGALRRKGEKKKNVCRQKTGGQNFKMKTLDREPSNDVENYQKNLPKSFFHDPSGPFLLSLLWLQKIGRTDLTKYGKRNENQRQFAQEFPFEYKMDPMFRIERKILKKKKKNAKQKISLSIGKTMEDKLILFNEKQVDDNRVSTVSSREMVLKEGPISPFRYLYRFSETKKTEVSMFLRIFLAFFFLCLAEGSIYVP
jgi:hypothetical protein